MDTTICGSTAYQYWRTPPIVKLLAAGSEADPRLPKIVTEGELTAFRADLAERLPLARACAASQRNEGRDLWAVREAWPLIAPCAEPPVELLATAPQERHVSRVAKYALWQSGLPAGAVRQITYDLSATSPAFTLMQLSARFSVTRMVLLASELCGSYAVYRAPRPVAQLLQRIADRGGIPPIGGWSPCLAAGGRLGDLWQHEPLATVEDLEDMLVRADFVRGRRTMGEALKLVKPLAASPFETQAGVLLGFSRRRGGEGLDGFSFNERVDFTPGARLLASRSFCRCDLYWPDGLDVECQSATFHDNGDSFISDSDRTAALRLDGIEVLPLTYAQLGDPERFAAFSKAVALALGRKRVGKSLSQLDAESELRKEVFVDWWKLPFSN